MSFYNKSTKDYGRDLLTKKFIKKKHRFCIINNIYISHFLIDSQTVGLLSKKWFADLFLNIMNWTEKGYK